MTKCEYCSKEIGLLTVRYTWLDKENNRAMHDNCYEEYKKNPENITQIADGTQVQKENTKGNKKRTITLTIIILLLIVSMIGVFAFEENKNILLQNDYNTLQSDYDNQQSKYNSLQSNYNSLSTRYNDVSDKYNDLSSDYNALNQLTTQYNQLPIDHLMELMNNKIREECQPNYNPWFGAYYYDKTSVDYAAIVCAHDLGRRYWSSVENNYEQITGTRLYNDAYNKIIKFVNIIGVSTYDSNVVKIEKILDYINSYITYQSDLNDEFLFPTETITFRSGDCDDFSILVASLFEYFNIQSAIGFFENTTLNMKHSMVLVHLSDLGNYGYSYYNDLRNIGLSEGKWIIIEPQIALSEQYAQNSLNKWSLIVASEIPNQ